MARDNDVFKVLVASGNAAVLAKDLTLGSLAVGQIGFFDATTSLSVDATSTPLPKKFLIAVGVDTDGDGVVDRIDTSAGQSIDKARIEAYTFKEHTSGRDMIFKVGGYKKIKCETTVGLKIELLNEQILSRIGNTPFTTTYTYTTPCCTTCETCEFADCNAVTLGLYNSIMINQDTQSTGITAVMIADQALTIAAHGVSADIAANAEISAADVAQLVIFNSTADEADKVCTSLRITTNPTKLAKFCCINLTYLNSTRTTAFPTLTEEFLCSGATITVLQTVAFDEGTGYDVQRLEYNNAGYKTTESVYRVNSVTGFPKTTLDFVADPKTNYDQFNIQYSTVSKDGWGQHEMPLSSLIAIPSASTVTRNSFATLMDLFTTPLGFDALADDAAAANVDASETVLTDEINNRNLDGIA